MTIERVTLNFNVKIWQNVETMAYPVDIEPTSFLFRLTFFQTL